MVSKLYTGKHLKNMAKTKTALGRWARAGLSEINQKYGNVSNTTKYYNRGEGWTGYNEARDEARSSQKISQKQKKAGWTHTGDTGKWL